MARTPTSARRSRISDEDDEEEQQAPTTKKVSPRTRVSLAQHLLGKVQLPQLGGPPRNDEEKKQVFRALAYLKSSGRTNRECSELLEVSERTICNYLTDELFLAIQGELQTESKELGHTAIGLLIEDAIAELYTIMKTDSSGFVRFKSAEALLNFAGYNIPRDEQKKDGRGEVERFLAILQERQSAGGRVQVNVQVNTPASLPEGEGGRRSDDRRQEVVEAEVREIPAELQAYYEPVQPGGLMPGATPRGTSTKREVSPPAPHASASQSSFPRDAVDDDHSVQEKTLF